MSTYEDESSAGIHLAGVMMAAFGSGDDVEYLRLANTADEVEVRWATVYMVGQVFAAFTVAAGGDEDRARKMMRNHAEGVAEDAAMTATGLIVRNARLAEGI